MNSTSPILLSDSDSESESKVRQLGPDEISRFIPASLTSTQTSGLGHSSFEREDHSYSQNSSHTSRTLENQTLIKIVDINDIMKGLSSTGLQAIIERENVASEKSNIVFSKTKNDLFIVRIHNPPSFATIHNPALVDRIHSRGPVSRIPNAESVSGIHNPTFVYKIHNPALVSCIPNPAASVSRIHTPVSVSGIHTPASVSRIQKSQLLPLNLINMSSDIVNLPPKTIVHRPVGYTEHAKSVSESQHTINRNFINENAMEKNKTPSHNVKESKKTTAKISYRCLDLKKNSYKIDCEGFTFFDRQGFFKAEEKRARRCSHILHHHIKVRQQIIDALLQEFENRRLCYKNRTFGVTQEEPMVSNPPSKVIDKTSIEKKKLALSKRKISKIEPKSKKKIDNTNLTKLKRSSSTLKDKQYLKQKSNRNRKTLQKNGTRQTKLQNNNSTNVENKYMVSKLKIPMYDDKFQPSPKSPVSNNIPATFIDENNFGIIEQLDINEKIYFVNEHKVVTSLYMDTFPEFNNAIQTKTAKILDKVDISSEEVASETIKLDKIGDDKYTAFCNFMTSFHSSQSHSESKSNIYLEHNYCSNP